MIELVLNGLEITTKEELHQHLFQGLDLPEWYGKNLDALYDSLTDISNDVCISLQNTEALEASLGRYAVAFQKVLKDAAKENEHLHIQM